MIARRTRLIAGSLACVVVNFTPFERLRAESSITPDSPLQSTVSSSAASLSMGFLHNRTLWSIVLMGVTLFLIATVLMLVRGINRFRIWGRTNATLNATDLVQCWSVVLRAVSMLALGVAAVFGLLRYLDSRELEFEHQKEELAQRTREFNVKLYNAQAAKALRLQTYQEAADVAATIATSDPSSPEAQIALKRFERLYWGQICIDENPNVRDRLIDFRKKLVAVGAVKPVGAVESLPPEIANVELPYLSLRLAKACTQDVAAETGATPAPSAHAGE